MNTYYAFQLYIIGITIVKVMHDIEQSRLKIIVKLEKGIDGNHFEKEFVEHRMISFENSEVT